MLGLSDTPRTRSLFLFYPFHRTISCSHYSVRIFPCSSIFSSVSSHNGERLFPSREASPASWRSRSEQLAKVHITKSRTRSSHRLACAPMSEQSTLAAAPGRGGLPPRKRALEEDHSPLVCTAFDGRVSRTMYTPLSVIDKVRLAGPIPPGLALATCAAPTRCAPFSCRAWPPDRVDSRLS